MIGLAAEVAGHVTPNFIKRSVGAMLCGIVLAGGGGLIHNARTGTAPVLDAGAKATNKFSYSISEACYQVLVSDVDATVGLDVKANIFGNKQGISQSNELAYTAEERLKMCHNTMEATLEVKPRSKTAKSGDKSKDDKPIKIILPGNFTGIVYETTPENDKTWRTTGKGVLASITGAIDSLAAGTNIQWFRDNVNSDTKNLSIVRGIAKMAAAQVMTEKCAPNSWPQMKASYSKKVAENFLAPANAIAKANGIPEYTLDEIEVEAPQAIVVSNQFGNQLNDQLNDWKDDGLYTRTAQLSCAVDANFTVDGEKPVYVGQK